MNFHIFHYGLIYLRPVRSIEQMAMKYRSRIDIISHILKAVNGDNATKTKITYKAFLNYNQMKENLAALTQNDLLRYNEDTQTFSTTEKGLRFLQIYNQIYDMIKEEEHQPLQQQMWIHR
jgi:predicted transcriptional regulator